MDDGIRHLMTPDELRFLEGIADERDQATEPDDPILADDYDPMQGSGDDPE